MEPVQILINAVIAAIVASFYAYLGYKANKRQSPTMGFHLPSALSIIIPTFLISLIASFTGLAPDILANTSFSMVVTKLIKKAHQV